MNFAGADPVRNLPARARSLRCARVVVSNYFLLIIIFSFPVMNNIHAFILDNKRDERENGARSE